MRRSELLSGIVSEHDTPFYLYDLKRLDDCLNLAKTEADKYGYHIHYAVKANSESKILSAIKSKEFGIDCVTGQEVQAGLTQGFSPDKIAFAGVGKSDWEIELAIERQIFTLNVESIEELRVVNEIANRIGKKANVALRLNPNIGAKTHHYITTGLDENKFGISEWQLGELFNLLPNLNGIDLIGLHFHIGSQIIDLEPFKNLCSRIHHFIEIFTLRGFALSHINAGGGLGFDYTNPDGDANPDFASYFKLFDDFLNLNNNQQLHFELGRSLVASCGDLVSKVLFVKKGQSTNFLIVDAGMTELLRPALYQAYHSIEKVGLKEDSVKPFNYDVVGPICESSDCFGKLVSLPECFRGDHILIRSTGAYGACMSSQYNLRKANPPVFINEPKNR